MISALAKRLRKTAAPASGFSLIELVVAMGIFTIFIAVLLTAIVSLTKGATQSRATAESASAVLNVFQNIDRQVRYANAINYPGQSTTTGYRYIEFRIPAASAPKGYTTCMQWRYLPADNLIQSREWEDATGSLASGWSTKVTSVVEDPAAPFPLTLVPGGGVIKQKLSLTVTAGDASRNATSKISTVYVARNSSNASTNVADANGQSATPVCQRTAVRP